MHRYHIPPKDKNSKKGGKKRSKDSSSASKDKDGTSIQDPNKQYPLHTAVIHTRQGEVLSLLEKGADPNQRLECSITPLHCLFLPTKPQHEDYHSQLSSAKRSNTRNAVLIIQYLVGRGARLLPDSCGLTPISLAILTKSRLRMHLLTVPSVYVDDVIHNNYFSMPKSSSADVDLLKHTCRLQRALSFFVKHGITPPVLTSSDPLDRNLEILSTRLSTELTDPMEVFASQFSSYLEVHSSRGRVLFNGVTYLLEQVVNQVRTSNNADLTFICLFNALVAWLNSHEFLQNHHVFYCWSRFMELLNCEPGRAKLECIVPVMMKFLYKFVLPLIESNTVRSADEISVTVTVISLMKTISDSEHSDIFPRRDQESVFGLLNKKQLVLHTINSCISFYDTQRSVYADRTELFDFALPYLYMNDRIPGHDGTLLHTAASLGNLELLRYFLKAGVLPFVKNRSGNTFIDVLKNQKYNEVKDDICSEFKLQLPYALTILTANVYIRYRLPLKHLHRYPLLRNLVINLCKRHECKQMCVHCYKEYFP